MILAAAMAVSSSPPPSGSARVVSASTSDPRRIAEAKANARRAGVEDLVSFIEQDAMQADVTDATVVTLYLLSSSNMKLRPILTGQLRSGSRIVSARLSDGRLGP